MWGLPAVPSRAKEAEEGDGMAEGLLMTGKARVVSSLRSPVLQRGGN